MQTNQRAIHKHNFRKQRRNFWHFICPVLIAVLSGVLIVSPLTGCVNGPVRYKSLGYKRYAAKEMFVRSPLPLKPIGLIAGSPVDCVVLVGDSVVLSVYYIWFTLKEGMGPDGQGVSDAFEDSLILGLAFLLVLPIVFVPWYSLGVISFPFAPKNIYIRLFGNETGIFAGNFNWIIRRGNEGYREELVLLDNIKNQETVLWTSRGWIEVDMSPNSHYLGIIDHCDRDQSAVLISSLTNSNGPRLVYQTPPDDRENRTEWCIRRWDVPNSKVLLKAYTKNIRTGEILHSNSEVSLQNQCMD